MSRIVLFAALIMAAATLDGSSAHAAYGFCMTPRPPSFYSSKPSKPFCAATRSCTALDVESYRKRLKSYFGELQQYLLDVDKFYKLAYEYAECETSSD